MNRPLLAASALGASAVLAACSPPSAEMSSEPNVATPDVNESAEDVTSTTEAPTTTAPVIVTIPPPTAPPTTVRQVVVWPEADSLTDVQWLIAQAFPESPAYAIQVFTCESGLRPDVDSNWPHVGLAQINVLIHAVRIARMGYTVADMYHAIPNLAVARALFDESGWQPWTCA